MDLFDNNPYYDSALPMPNSLPKFHIEEQTQNRNQNIKPNWIHLNPLFCQLKQNKSAQFKLCDQGQQKGLFEVYTTDFNLQEYARLDDIRQFRKDKGLKCPPMEFISQNHQYEIYEQIETNYDIDLGQQRGLNHFIHSRDYLQDCVTIIGSFSSMKNLVKFGNQISSLYLPYKIKIFTRNNNLDLNYKGRHQTVVITQKEVKNAQILYLKTDSTKNIADQLWNYVNVMYNQLDDGGCFIFQIQDISNQYIAQFLYLFQKLFTVVTLNNNSNINSYINVGCYGYLKQNSLEVLEKIFEADIQQYNFFRTRDLAQDINFEAPIVQFYKEVLAKRAQQLKLVVNLQENQFGNYEEFEGLCEQLKKQQQIQQEEKRNKRAYHTNNHYSYHNQQDSGNTQILNQKPIIQQIDIKFEHQQFSLKAAQRRYQGTSAENQKKTKVVQLSEKEKAEQAANDLRKLMEDLKKPKKVQKKKK